MWVWKSIFSQFEKTTSDVNKIKNISHIFPKFGHVMSKKKKKKKILIKVEFVEIF